MSPQHLLLIGIILGIGFLLVTNKLRADVVALLSLVVMGLTGLVDPTAAFSGFSRSAVITILSLFMITAGLEKTGATRILGRRLSHLAGASETRAIIVIMLSTAMLSLFMNTIAAAAVLLPIVISITRRTDLKPSRLLMPLAFASLLGGMATLFTTANILVSTALVDQGFQPYGVLDFIPVGLPMAIAGIAFMALVGRKLLPAHSLGGEKHSHPGTSLAEIYDLLQAVSGVYVEYGSSMAGKTLVEGDWGKHLGLNVVGLSRDGQLMLAPSPDTQILAHDVVIFTGSIDDDALAQYGLSRARDPVWQGKFISSQVSLVELVLAPRSPFAGKTLAEINFREKYNLTVIALWRAGQTIRKELAEIPLAFGDALLVQGTHDRARLLRDERGFVVLGEDIELEPPGFKAWLAISLTGAVIVLSALNVLPIAEAAFSAALFMVLLGCMTMDEAYSAIDWHVIFLIVGMLPLGLAMTSTGFAELIGEHLVNLLGSSGPIVSAGSIFLITTLLTQVMGGQTTAVVLAPIAIATATKLHLDPRGIGIAVAMGCSTAFLTPFSHPANVLVMGPGGYTLRDYLKVGLPLSGVLFIILLIALTVFWL